MAQLLEGKKSKGRCWNFSRVERSWKELIFSRELYNSTVSCLSFLPQSGKPYYRNCAGARSTLPQPVFNPVTFKLPLIFFLLRLSTVLTLPGPYSSVVSHVIQEVIQNLFHWLLRIPECFTSSCSFSSPSVYSWNGWGSVNDWQTWLAEISCRCTEAVVEWGLSLKSAVPCLVICFAFFLCFLTECSWIMNT